MMRFIHNQMVRVHDSTNNTEMPKHESLSLLPWLLVRLTYLRINAIQSRFSSLCTNESSEITIIYN